MLRLVAWGLTNTQVAEQLVISLRTVNTHLKSIYGKNPVTSRSAASRSRCTSRIGGTPKRLLYSRLKWEASWYPTR